MRKVGKFLIVLIALVIMSIGYFIWQESQDPVEKPQTDLTVITGAARIIDGDSLVIEAQDIRLLGIDAFEMSQTCGQLACGRTAKAELTEFTGDHDVTCQGRDRDHYGRYLMSCTNYQNQDLAAHMVRSGLAVAYRRYSQDYVDEEEAARSAKSGAWAYWFESPETFRHNMPDANR